MTVLAACEAIKDAGFDVNRLVFGGSQYSLLHLVALSRADESDPFSSEKMPLAERVRKLLELGACPSVLTANHETPLELAMKCSNEHAISAFAACQKVAAAAEQVPPEQRRDPFGFFTRDALGRSNLQRYCTASNVIAMCSTRMVSNSDFRPDALGRLLLHCTMDAKTRDAFLLALARMNWVQEVALHTFFYARDVYGFTAGQYNKWPDCSTVIPPPQPGLEHHVQVAGVLWFRCEDGTESRKIKSHFDDSRAQVRYPLQHPPLHLACASGDLDEMQKQIDTLRASGELHKIDERNLKGFTPLHIACARGNKEAAFKLIDAGADVQSKAALRLEVVNRVEKGLPEGVTPFELACLEGHAELALELLSRQRTDEEGVPRLTKALRLACLHENPTLLKALLERKVGAGQALGDRLFPLSDELRLASEGRTSKNVQVLLEWGARQLERGDEPSP